MNFESQDYIYYSIILKAFKGFVSLSYPFNALIIILIAISYSYEQSSLYFIYNRALYLNYYFL